MLLVCFQKIVVKLIAMPMAFPNHISLISVLHQRSLFQRTGISAQTHGSALFCHPFLFLHQINYRVFGDAVHLCRMRIIKSQHIASKLDDSTLETKAYTKKRNLVLTGISH